MEYVASCNFENLEIHYSIEERKLGTGGAILNALNVLDEEFGVLYGDSFLPINFSKVFQVFGNSQKKALMTVFRNQNRHYINNVNFVNNNIINYSKTQSDQGMHHIDYGFLIFKKDVFKLFSNRDNFDLSEVIEMLVKSGEIEGLEMQHRFYEVGSFLGIQQLEKFLKGRD
jgi:NDP-sugar pyrophosphorylase family protein